MRSRAKALRFFVKSTEMSQKLQGGDREIVPKRIILKQKLCFIFTAYQETFAKFAMSGAGSNGQPPLQKVAARAIALLLGQKQKRPTPSCHTITYLCHFQQHPGRRPRLLLFYPRASPHEPPAPTLLFLTGSISMPAARPSIQPA
jgi:hypothetical protein